MASKPLFIIIGILVILLTACKPETSLEKEETTMRLTSPAFEDGGEIPAEYTCDGKDVSPELKIGDIPEEAKSLALIMDDPDAPSGTFVHWVIWNIPTDTKTIKKGEKISWLQGTTGFGKQKYGGPCPPSGTHRYVFKLYALDSMLELQKGATKEELLKAMEDHIVAEIKLIGNYKRS